MSKLASFILAIGFSFALFVGMTFLIKPKALEIESEPQEKPVITFEFDETTVTEIDWVLPEEPKEIPPPQTVDAVIESEDTRVAIVDFEKPKFIDASAGIGMPNIVGTMGTGGKGQQTPRVHIPPRYPRDAQINNIEGYVTLRFDITTTGHTTNITVIDSSPRGVFEKAAKRALRKWKYNPEMQGDKAIMQIGQQVTLAFELEKDV